MNTLIKLLVGVLLLVIPLGMYAFEIINGINKGLNLPVLGTIHLWKSLITLILGSVPPFVMLIGLFIIWLELDEWRIEKELQKEEEPEEVKIEKPKTKKKTKKKGRPRRKKK